MLGLLRDHKDLGIHSEMVPDSVIELIQAGVINGRAQDGASPQSGRGIRARAARRCSISSTTIRPSSSTARRTANDPFVIAQNDRMVALNSAIEVDLTGQVCADSMGHTPYSGIGGQVDFLRGAARSQGRHADHHAAVDGEGRDGVADRAAAAAGRRAW